MRCTGHCCRSFPLSSGAFLKICEAPDEVRDGHKLLDMLIPLGVRPRPPALDGTPL